jgi:hypothetical protein
LIKSGAKVVLSHELAKQMEEKEVKMDVKYTKSKKVCNTFCRFMKNSYLCTPKNGKTENSFYPSWVILK